MRRAALTLAIAIPLLAPQARAQEDPAARGPYAVTSFVRRFTVNGGKKTYLDVRLPDAPGPRPLVLLCHGWAAHTTKFAGLADHLASRGLAVALFEQPDAWGLSTPRWARQLSEGLAELLRWQADPTSPLHGRVDAGRLALVGHSYGAAASIVVAAGDPRVRCVVALAPVNQWNRGYVLAGARRLACPFLVLRGQWDWIAGGQPKDFVHAATGARPRELLEVKGGGHDLYTGGGDRELLARRHVTAWLERFLAGAPDPQGYGDGRAAARDRDARRLSKIEVVAPAGLASALGGP
jgi:pimeloyl-ACP methyl ester carboxylesterase